ncbi:MAG: hypothetical protein KR126chlam4_00802 [Candidatus Anoxychlamydiales bacterium]|nr:hypothetical protein [Candidatus Anoxychlamydiales bacterium]
MTTISRFSARSDSRELQSSISSENGVDKRDEYGRTRLMLAALSNQTKSVQALVNVDDIDVNVKDLSGKTALMIASILGHVESVKVLLTARGIKVNKSDEYFDLLALREAEDEQAIERKRNRNKSTNRLGVTALMFAAENGHSEIVDALLLDSKIDVNKTDRHNGFTALIWAVTNNQIEVVKKLLAAKGIDVNIADKFDRTALFFAAGMSRSEIDESKVDEISKGSPEIVKMLLKHGAYVDKDDEEWINGLFNTKIAEILRAAIRKNNILIGKMEEVVFRITEKLNNDKSKGKSFDGVPIDVIDRKLVQELFDDGLLKLEKSRLAKDKEIEDKIASIDKKLENLIDKNDVLYERYEIKKSSLIEKRKINKNLALNTFYLTIRSLLEARLISMILLLGGVIKRNETKGEKIAVRGCGSFSWCS